ncbi:EF-hand [Biscogniauxia mediterranea]|nr:EF-hand [Biscogniauxia mediterranea]
MVIIIDDSARLQQMPPRKRKTATAGDSGSPPKEEERRSKLAKEHNISAREEREIREAFALFAEPGDGDGDGDDDVEEGVIPTKDVRRAMVALGLPPSKPELAEFLSILDPDDEGFAAFEPFLAICALKLHSTNSSSSSRSNPKDRNQTSSEIDEAFRLFVTGAGDGTGTGAGGGAGGGGSSGSGSTLTLGHLKRVAMTLKQDVDEDLLRDMILEANGGAGVGRGVSRAEFEDVMRRAGVWK